MFLVRHKEYPVFLLRLNLLEVFAISLGSRGEAVLQMRARFKHLFEGVEIETLYLRNDTSQSLERDLMTPESEEWIHQVVNLILHRSSKLVRHWG